MVIRVVRTYHGTGGKEGYKYQVEKFIEETGNFVLIGELEDFPIDKKIVNLNNVLYEIYKEYDCNETLEDEENEKTIIELKKYYPPKYQKLEWKEKK